MILSVQSITARMPLLTATTVVFGGCYRFMSIILISVVTEFVAAQV